MTIDSMNKPKHSKLNLILHSKVQNIDCTGIGFDLIAIVLRKRKRKKDDTGILVVFKLNMSQQCYSFPQS